MTFLRWYGLGAVGLTMLVTCLGVEVALVIRATIMVLTGAADALVIGLPALLQANFCVAAVLISFGGLIGKINPAQLVVLVVLECLFYGSNKFVLEELVGINDVGGTVVIHMFGAYYGLAVAWLLGMPEVRRAQLHGAFPPQGHPHSPAPQAPTPHTSVLSHCALSRLLEPRRTTPRPRPRPRPRPQPRPRPRPHYAAASLRTTPVRPGDGEGEGGHHLRHLLPPGHADSLGLLALLRRGRHPGRHARRGAAAGADDPLADGGHAHHLRSLLVLLHAGCVSPALLPLSRLTRERGAWLADQGSLPLLLPTC